MASSFPEPGESRLDSGASAGVLCHAHPSHTRGFTLIELLIVMAIIMTVSAIAVPSLQAALDDARVARAVADLHVIETDIQSYELQTGSLPDSLNNLGDGLLVDPWGNRYQYRNLSDGNGNGIPRTDRFGVPLNDDYELYSLGKDGLSVTSLAGPESQDDIVRADDGFYVGLGSQF